MCSCQSVFIWHLPHAQLQDWLPFCALLVSCQSSDGVNRQQLSNSGIARCLPPTLRSLTLKRTVPEPCLGAEYVTRTQFRCRVCSLIATPDIEHA